jgi:hypothetical protein
MAVIDCTLSNFTVPGFVDVSPSFGTKKPDGQSVLAREANVNIMMPFVKQRPLAVVENSNTSEIQAHTAFNIQTSGITLTLGNGGFIGCRVKVLNSTASSAQVAYGAYTRSINAGMVCEFEYTVNGWIGINIESHTDMVDGIGRDLMKVLLGIDFTTLTTQAQRNAAIAQVMAELRKRCNNNGEIDSSGIPDFQGLMIGDYIDGIDFSGITAPSSAQAPNGGPQAWNDTYKNNRIMIAGFNTYKGVGDTENNKNHVLFIFRNVLWKQRQRATDDNTGGYAYNNAANEIRAYLEGLTGDGTGTFATRLETAMNGGAVPPGGKYLYTIRKLHSKKHGATWVEPVWNSYTVFLPTEIEVFGYETFGDEAGAANGGKGIGQYNTNVHFPIYQKGYAYRIKRHNGSRAWWWEQTPNASHATHFCYVSTLGSATYTLASFTDGGVSPAFCVR